jgi:hypothetical protein
MWLSNGYIDRRPLMERDGSGVSALRLDGFVVVRSAARRCKRRVWLAVGDDRGQNVSTHL